MNNQSGYRDPISGNQDSHKGKSIKIYEATYQINTPMFLSGADQNSAEFRVASFKGAFRFWWRALAWEAFGKDLSAIKEQEDLLFGSSD